MVSEPTLAVSCHIRAEVCGHEHRHVRAEMPPACGRARGVSVRGHLGCAGTGRTDVAQGPLALDARTWHMGLLALDVWDVAKRGDPGGI